MQAVSSPHTPHTTNDETPSSTDNDATPRERHAKRFSHATDSSYEAPSIATTTASGQARRAADSSNRETLLAYWNAEQDDAAATAAAAASHVAVNDDVPNDGFLTPNLQDPRNGHSPTSRSRSPGERRNLSAYRPVAGRWTSQIDDQGVESPIAQQPDTMAEAASPSQRAEPAAAAEPQGRGLGLQSPTVPAAAMTAAPGATPHSEHRKSGSTPTPLETVEERSGDEHSRHDRSPERSYRKPLPEHEFGNSSPYDKFASDPFHAPTSPTSPIRNMAELQSMLQQQQQAAQRPPSQQRFSVADSDGMTSSKRTSDQSHFSAATGALHQHVERLRAGPTYQIDEDATQLITGRTDEDQQRAPFSYNPTPPSPIGHRSTMSTTMLPMGNGITSSPQSGRGRAWSLSLINKLKHRTRKASDASLLSARVPSLTRLNSPPQAAEEEKASAKGTTSSILGRKASVSRAPLSPLSSARREAEQGATEAALASSGSPVEHLRSRDAGGKRRHSRDFAPHLYQLARRPSARKASPTTASSDAAVFSSRAASGLVAAAVDSPTMQRNYSATSTRTQKPPQQRPASIGSRKSSRSKRSSSGSLRAAASSANGGKAQATRSKEAIAADKRLTIKVATPPASSSSATTVSSPWWNPWSRKGSTTGLSGTSAGGAGDQAKRKDDDYNGGWIDETEDERGIVSPVAEDPNKVAQQMQGGPEKSQQPWAPAWSNRIHQNGGEGDMPRPTQQAAQINKDAAEHSPSKEAFATEVLSGSEQQHEHVAYITPPSTLTPRTETSGFSSLAPLPAPAPVPPPRKNRKVRRRESGSNRTSSSSPNSPALGPEEHSPTSGSHASAAVTAAAVEKDVASSVDLDDRRASISSAVSHHTHDRYATPLLAGAAMMQSEASHPASSSADARESLLSDDLDWATPQTNNGAGATSSSFSDTTSTTPFRRTTATSAAEADEMDSEANLHSQRASLVEARRPRGSTIQSQNTYNLSPVREIQTPESRFMSEQDPRSGTQSAASTFDQQGWTSHHRVSSGASLTRHLVMTPPGNGQASADVEGSSPSQQQQRRPLPAPSVVAEPRTDLSYVHRANSIGSSFGTSTVGAGADGSGVTAAGGARGGHASISSMKKHTGQPSSSPSEQAIAAAAVAAVANKRAKQREGMSPTGNGARTDGSLVGRGPADGRTRSTSMPSKPRSPLSEGLAYSYEDSNQGYRTFSPTTTARLARTSGGNNIVRDSWRSSSGPWDGKVVNPGDRVQIPAARGISRPTFATVRRQRSRSVPLNELSQQEEAEPDTAPYEAGPPSLESPVQYVHDEPIEAVPFAETAVQASLAALQALEKSEQAEKEGDWRARWQSEKLLGFSSSSQPASILIKARQKESAKLHPHQPHNDRLDTSSPHQDRRQPRSKQHLDVLSSGASQNGGGEYESSNVGGTASESETAASRHRRRRRREDRERSSLRQPLKNSRQDDAVLRSKRNSGSKQMQRPTPDGMPVSSQRIPSAAEWDEMVVPAHARRYEGNSSSLGDQSGTASFMASGMVAPGSPQAAQSPDSVQEVLSSAPHQVNHPTGETSMTTMFDHGSIMSYGDASGAAVPSTHAKHRPRKSSNAKRFESSAFIDEEGGGGSKRRGGTESGSRHARRHDKYVNSSTVSLTKSTKSRIVRKGYGSDDILAWQASLSLAVLPPTNESMAE